MVPDPDLHRNPPCIKLGDVTGYNERVRTFYSEDP